MVAIAQLVRASDCDSEGRGFEPHYLPQLKRLSQKSKNQPDTIDKARNRVD